MFCYEISFNKNGTVNVEEMKLSLSDFVSLIVDVLPETSLAKKHSFNAIEEFAKIESDDLNKCLAYKLNIKLDDVVSVKIK